MSYRHIVALAFGGEGDDETLAFAARLAVEHQATIVVFPFYPDAALDLVSFGMTLGTSLPPATLDAMDQAHKDMRHHLAAACKRAATIADLAYGASERPPRMILAEAMGQPAIALSRALALADLVVVGQISLTTATVAASALAQTLLQQRVPVLIGRGDPDCLSGKAVIAWDGSAQAGAAVRQALPLLIRASTIFAIQCLGGLDPEAADPAFEPLGAYLRDHDIELATTEMVASRPENGALIRAAESLGARLLIAGAYGHSRLQETVFGGATRAFLADVDGPSLLLAH